MPYPRLQPVADSVHGLPGRPMLFAGPVLSDAELLDCDDAAGARQLGREIRVPREGAGRVVGEYDDMRAVPDEGAPKRHRTIGGEIRFDSDRMPPLALQHVA